MHPLLLRHRSPRPLLRRLRRKPKGIDELQTILVSGILSVPLAMTALASKRQKTANPVIETILQEEASQPPATETEFELAVVSPPAPPPVGTWSPESCE